MDLQPQQPKKIVTAVAKLGVKQNPPIFNTLPLLIKCIIISPFALIYLIRSPVGPLPAWDPIPDGQSLVDIINCK